MERQGCVGGGQGHREGVTVRSSIRPMQQRLSACCVPGTEKAGMNQTSKLPGCAGRLSRGRESRGVKYTTEVTKARGEGGRTLASSAGQGGLT